jgi:hypothetical protein
MPTWLWPGWDQVYPNLIASLIWAVPGALAHLHTRRHLRALHRKHDQLIRGERE